MRRLVFIVLAIACLQALLAWTNYLENWIWPFTVVRPKAYMARGERSIRFTPDRHRFSPGETFTVHFSFRCDHTRYGDRTFAYVLAHCDSAVILDEGRLIQPRTGLSLVLTHRLDTGPVARGWTISDVTAGDSIQLIVEGRVMTRPHPFGAHASAPEGSFDLEFGMDPDEGEPDTAGVRFTRRIEVLTSGSE